MNAHVLLSFLLPCVSAFIPGPNPGATYTPSRFRLPVTQAAAAAAEAPAAPNTDGSKQYQDEPEDPDAVAEVYTGPPLTAQEITDTMATLLDANRRARHQKQDVIKLKNKILEAEPPDWKKMSPMLLPKDVPEVKAKNPDADFKALSKDVEMLGLQVHLVEAEAGVKRGYMQQKDADIGIVVQAKSDAERLKIQQDENEAEMAKMMKDLQLQTV